MRLTLTPLAVFSAVAPLVLLSLPLARAASPLTIEYLEPAYSTRRDDRPALYRSTPEYRCQLHPVYIAGGVPPFAVDAVAADDDVFSRSFSSLRADREPRALATVAAQNETDKILLWTGEGVPDGQRVVLRVTDAVGSAAYTVPRMVLDASYWNAGNLRCYDTHYTVWKDIAFCASALGLVAGFVALVVLGERMARLRRARQEEKEGVLVRCDEESFMREK
ncbi:hypothetical protein JCM10213_007075 [Rhodosporidiobolus nylandii]